MDWRCGAGCSIGIELRRCGDLRRQARIFPWSTTPLAASPHATSSMTNGFWQATDRSLRWSWETVAEPGMVVVAPNVDYKPERLPGRESALRKVGL